MTRTQLVALWFGIALFCFTLLGVLLAEAPWK